MAEKKEKYEWGKNAVKKEYVVTKIVEAYDFREAAQIAQCEGRVVSVYELDKKDDE